MLQLGNAIPRSICIELSRVNKGPSEQGGFQEGFSLMRELKGTFGLVGVYVLHACECGGIDRNSEIVTGLQMLHQQGFCYRLLKSIKSSKVWKLTRNVKGLLVYISKIFFVCWNVLR